MMIHDEDPADGADELGLTGDGDGAVVAVVGLSTRVAVGLGVGGTVGIVVGDGVGVIGDRVGRSVGPSVGAVDVGDAVGTAVGAAVGAAVGNAVVGGTPRHRQMSALPRAPLHPPGTGWNRVHG